MDKKLDMVTFFSSLFHLENTEELTEVEANVKSSFGRTFLEFQIYLKSDENIVNRTKNTIYFHNTYYSITLEDKRNDKELTESTLQGIKFLSNELRKFTSDCFYIKDKFSTFLSSYILELEEGFKVQKEEYFKNELTKLQYKKLDDYIVNTTTAHRKRINERNKNTKTYLIKCNNTGLVKIGKSVNPKIREKTLQSENPNQFLICVFNKNIEHILHTHFKEYRVRGEWFKLLDIDIELIKKRYEKNIIF